MAKAPRSAQLVAVVDDDPLVREAVEELVCSVGYEAKAFGSADAFLACDSRGEVDCIVADIQMPGRSGLELQALLAAEPKSPPIIFLTGLPQGDPRRRMAEARSPCCLAKPVVPEELIRCIEAALADTDRG
ncbi:MAG: response regulator [Caulobacteraceae bacterium]|nr:response regulator [Caulobacteraceae bacterium]